MDHLKNRKFAIVGLIDLVAGRLKHIKVVIEISDQLNELISSINFSAEAPFSWVALVYYLGNSNNFQLRYKPINKRDGDLPISLELNMKLLEWADKNNLELLHDIFMVAALKALIQVAKKYKLPDELFSQERAKYKDIPNTIEECEALGGKGLLK